MEHLGADVAAYVDGQLPPAAMQDARAHLEACESCRHDVRQQQLLKSRMSSVAAPEPPPGLLASLSGLATDLPPSEPWWQRVLRSAVVRGGVVLVGASVVVVAAAYALGGVDERMGDEVMPPFERFVTAFEGSASTTGTMTPISSSAISDQSMKRLDESGWPCHQHLAGGFRREGGQWWDHREVIVLSYSDGRSRLQLFEQNGALDRDALVGFDEADWDGARVWVREGDPMILTWDAAGVVYTVLTDAGLRRLDGVVAQLPTAEPEAGAVDRVRAGLDRMVSWPSAA